MDEEEGRREEKPERLVAKRDKQTESMEKDEEKQVGHSGSGGRIPGGNV